MNAIYQETLSLSPLLTKNVRNKNGIILNPGFYLEHGTVVVDHKIVTPQMAMEGLFKLPLIKSHSQLVTDWYTVTQPLLESDLPDDVLFNRKSLVLQHDIGKSPFPFAQDPGLSDSQMDLIHQHPAIAMEILRGHDVQALEFAGLHHEKYDGSGYPLRLKGHEVSLDVRNIRLADVLGTIANPEVKITWAPTLTPEEALLQLESQVGSTFDPRVFDVVASNLSLMKSGDIIAKIGRRDGPFLNSVHNLARIYNWPQALEYIENIQT